MSDYLRGSGQSLLGKKVLLCGLSEAGKTAIRSVVFGGKEAIEVRNLGATLNYVRQFISLGDRQVTLMDLGGQRIFLDRFITKFSPFVFHNVATLLFVVDTFDSQRFESSKHYFIAALDRLNKYSPNALAFILLHKMDLIADDPNKGQILEYLRNLFQQDVERELTFYETTIYDDTIKEALHEVLEISFPEIYARAPAQPAAVPPAAMPSTPAKKSSAPTPRATTPARSPTPPVAPKQPVSSAEPLPRPKPIPDIPLSVIARAFTFIEDPSELPPASRETVPTGSLEPAEASSESDFSGIAKAFRFIETGEISSDSLGGPPEAVSESEMSVSASESLKEIVTDVDGGADTIEGDSAPEAASKLREEIEASELAAPVESLAESSEVTETEEVIPSPEHPEEVRDIAGSIDIEGRIEEALEEPAETHEAAEELRPPLSDEELDDLIFSVDDLLPTPQPLDAQDPIADATEEIQSSDALEAPEAADMEIKDQQPSSQAAEEVAAELPELEQELLQAELSEEPSEPLVDSEESISALELTEQEISLPENRFDTHPTLDEEFDIFEAAEEFVRYLEAVRSLFKLSFIALKMRDAESLVHVGSLEQFDALANQGLEHAESQRRPDQPPSPFIMTENDLFILGEPIGPSLIMIVIGSSHTGAETHLLSKMSEFKNQVTKMVTITFSEMF
ncbi:MAG: ADP-ribosylation factor-like protein [Candidatus Thorarchaeota archaeon]